MAKELEPLFYIWEESKTFQSRIWKLALIDKKLINYNFSLVMFTANMY